MTGALSHRHRKWLGWFRVLARFASAQLVIQLLGFLSGILIVQHLSKPDYAWFTIANALVGTMAMLADSGVSGALSAVGGSVWRETEKFSSLIITALGFRRRLAVVSAILLTPPFVWMLVKNQAPAAIIAIVVPVALLGFFLQITSNVMGVGIWFRQELRKMQLLGLAPALLRVALLSLACLLFIDARVAIVIGTLAPGLQVLLLRRWERHTIDWNAPVSADYRSRILTVVKKQAPLTIFHCVQGQIIIWLISIFGGEERVAEIGALGRFAILFTLISSVMNGIVVPRFARCQEPGILRRRYWQVAFAFAILSGSLVAFSAAFPRLLLWVLGSQYSNLEHEVWLMMLSAASSGMFVCLVSMTYAKGWILPAAISIPMEIITQIILILTFDISTVRGVLFIGCFSSLPLIVLNIIVAHSKMRSPPAPEAT